MHSLQHYANGVQAGGPPLLRDLNTLPDRASHQAEPNISQSLVQGKLILLSPISLTKDLREKATAPSPVGSASCNIDAGNGNLFLPAVSRNSSGLINNAYCYWPAT